MPSRMMSYRPDFLASTLKTASLRLVDKAGGVRTAADFCRVGKSSLGYYCSESEEHEESYAPIDVVLQLERHAKSPIVTAQLASMQGYCLVELPKPSEVKDVLRHVAEVASGAGQVMNKAASAVEDGKITRREAAQLDEAISAVLTTLVTLQKGLER